MSPRTSSLRVAAVQLPGRVEPAARRLDRIDAAFRSCDADLVVFPEASLPGYTREGVAPGAAEAGRRWALDAAHASGRWVAIGLVEPDASVLFLAGPKGQAHRYAKRFVTWAESGVWRPGHEAVIAPTPLGRLGLVLCADLVQPDTWTALHGAADFVVVSAAWPDYRGRQRRLPPGVGRALRPLLDGAGPRRDEILAAAPRALGSPLIYCNAGGPWNPPESFSGQSRILDHTGDVLARVEGEAGVAVATVQPGPHAPTGTLEHPLAWRAFCAAHRAAAAVRRTARGRGR